MAKYLILLLSLFLIAPAFAAQELDINKAATTIPYEMKVSRGMIPAHSDEHKFGHNEDVGTAREDVWDLGGTYTYSSTAAEYHISSSDAADTEPITIEYLDANYDAQEVTVTLAGQTETVVGSGITILRVQRAYNSGTSDLVGTVYIYEDDTITAGVPDTATKIRAAIEAAHNQTLMTMYTIPAGKTAYISHVGYYAATATGKAVDVLFQQRRVGKVFRVIDHVHLFQTSIDTHHDTPLKFPEKTDIKFSATASASGGTISVTYQLILVDGVE